MSSENENQFGRRRSFKKPSSPKVTPEEKKETKSGEEVKKEKSPEQILSILESEKKSDPAPKKQSSTEERRSPRTSDRESRPRRTPRGRNDRPGGESKPSRYQSRRPSSGRDERPRRSNGIKLSVIIPAFNEEGNIAELFKQFDELMRNLPYKAEMILVDDGSVDKTYQLAREGQSRFKWLKLYKHRANRGLTAALETGFGRAAGKILCFYPADLQYHANEIPKMVSKIDSGADVVTGWKQGKYSKSLGSYIYNKLSRWLFKVNVHDLNSVKMFKKEVAENFTFRKGWHRYMVVMAAQAGYEIEEVKVKLFPRKQGKSKFGLSQLPVGFLDLLSVKFELSFTTKPLLFFGTAGITCGLLGFIIGLVSLYLRFVEHAGFRPLLYAVILLIVSGLMLFAIGFLAELIVSMKEQISRKR